MSEVLPLPGGFGQVALPAAEVEVPPPAPRRPSPGWEHAGLYRRVRSALFAVPTAFASDLQVTGVPATDLHNFSAPLAATIEASTVDTLNRLREQWDPDGSYATYRFVRQPQRFPDVVLRSDDPDADPPIALGIELKGWYALAKEGEPSFRFRITPGACAPQDLLVIYPWVFSQVVSGSPRLLRPFVTEARYAAEYRNWYWEQIAGDIGDRSIRTAEDARPYPEKKDLVSDEPVSDRGGNFGRLARTGIMADWLTELHAELLAGIPLDAWRRFLKGFTGD